jgi:hypothetical protein
MIRTRSHHLITYRGRPVALVAPERVHVLASWLQDSPPGDPDARFVLFMCTFARMVQLGRLPPPFSSTAAERWARTALIDDDDLLAHPHRPAGEQARCAGVPTDQIATRRRELDLPRQQL